MEVKYDGKTIDSEEIFEALKIIVGEDVTELRGLKCYPGGRQVHAMSTFSNDNEELTKVVIDVARFCQTLSIAPQSLESVLLARSNNRFQYLEKGGGTSDANVIQWKWFIIDIDPKRISGISAIETEKESAIQLAQNINDCPHEICLAVYLQYNYP